MRRREFISLVGGAAAAWPLAARAQQGERTRRLGVLATGISENDPEWQARMAALLPRLQKLGWTVGNNIQIEYRYVAGDAERVQATVKELTALAPDVILVMSNPLLAALMKETRTIPIVFVQVADPVSSGFVASLVRPGGNVTGFTNFELSMGGKWLEVLKEAAPQVTRAAVLYHPHTPANVSLLHAAEAAGLPLGVAVTAAPVNNLEEIDRAVMAAAREPNGGVVLIPHPVTVGTGARARIAEWLIQHRLPIVGAFRFVATSGGLISYGVDAVDLYRRSADYVDRILRGANPGELPVQAPIKFELVINLKTAKALGIEVPPTLLARADEVIE
jgi:putative ABC transport system substrate-binding protein